MKRLFASLAILGALIACTRYSTPDDSAYYVADEGTGIFRAEVEPLSGTWTWKAARSKVGVYAGAAENVLYIPRAAYDGATGEVQLMGQPVSGKAYAYMPYRASGMDAVRTGRMPLPEEQTFHESANAQIEGNTVLVAAEDENGKFLFRHYCGALHLKLKISFPETVERLILSANEPICGYLDITGEADERITRAGHSVTVNGIGKPCSEAAPLDVWVMLPEGSYSGVYVTLSGATTSVSTIVGDQISITTGRETAAEAREEKNEYGNPDFVGEEVNYD